MVWGSGGGVGGGVGGGGGEEGGEGGREERGEKGGKGDKVDGGKGEGWQYKRKDFAPVCEGKGGGNIKKRKGILGRCPGW